MVPKGAQNARGHGGEPYDGGVGKTIIRRGVTEIGYPCDAAIVHQVLVACVVAN